MHSFIFIKSAFWLDVSLKIIVCAMYEVGVAKVDITAFKLGVGMMGYGMYFNIVKGVETDLFARAVVIRDTTTAKKVVLVNAEICFVTVAIRRGVIKKLRRKYSDLGFSEDAIMLTAQHTHSAPGGYSHFGLYNMSIPGFAPEVYQKVVDGMVSAIVEANESLQPATIKLSDGEFEADKEVGFNRSIKAYNLNPEVKKPITRESAHLAIDRRMLLMRFDDLEGNPIGSWNWFGVHSTSLSNDNHRICSDNKGYAAKFLEDSVNRKAKGKFVSAFAQRKAGDVSPNWIKDKKKKWTRGKYEDDFESAKYNGKIQFNHALNLFNKAQSSNEIPLQIDHAMTFVDFRKVTVDKEFAWGDNKARTGPACHGVKFFAGTKEGPGMAPAIAALATTISRSMRAYELTAAKFMNKEKAEEIYLKYRVHGVKDILVEADARRIMGTRNIKNLILPGWADGAIAAFKKYHANGSLGDKPWIPQILPLQLIIIGNVALAAIPGEITTIAGKRLEDSLLEILAERGVTEVVCSTYANAYCGYVTTYQEYQAQCYEGGHTVFGEHFHGAIQTKYKELALQMLKPTSERTVTEDGRPLDFSEEELALRSFDIKTQKRLIQL